MANEERTCPKCGVPLLGGAAGGHCLTCLLNLALPEAVVPAEAVGDRIGRYRLLERLGEGGCGVVYRAEQEEPVRREVALKVIKLGMDTRSVIARFEAERQALALMDHANIARVLDAGSTEAGRPYFVMELVRGPRLTDYCDAHGLTTRERLELFISVCAAVQHAHQKGVIHRDLKPSNVLVALNDGRPVPKIIDFGIAKATGDQPLTDKTLFTAHGQLLGTPAYMSPEQAGGGGDVDTRSDLYSLGVLLYELLTGHLPFAPEELRRAAADQVVRIIREREPVRPSARLTTLAAADLTAVAQRRQTEPALLSRQVAGDLDWIVMKALEKDRERRYASANGFIEDLSRHLNDEPVSARPPTRLRQVQRLFRRHRVLFTAGTAVLASLVIGLGMALLSLRREKVATAEARTISSASDFLQAQSLIKEERFGPALTGLARSIRSDPSNHVAVTRLATLMTSHSWWIPSQFIRTKGHVEKAFFSPDGHYLLTSSRPHYVPDNGDNACQSVSIWDAHLGEWVCDLDLPPKARLESVAFSPDGDFVGTIVSTNAMPSAILGEPFLAVWRTISGQKVSEYRSPLPPWHAATQSHSCSILFSPDGRHMICSFSGYLTYWDIFHGMQMRIAQSTGDYHSIDHSYIAKTNLYFGRTDFFEQTFFAQFDQNGSRLLAVSRKAVSLWDVASGHSETVVDCGFIGETEVEHKGIAFAQLCPDNEHVYILFNDDISMLYDTRSHTLLPDRYVFDSGEYPHLDQQHVLLTDKDHAGYTIRVFHPLSGDLLAEPEALGMRWNSLFEIHEANRLYHNASGGAMIWDHHNQRPIASMESETPLDFLAFSSSGTQIAAILNDGVEIWSRVAVAAPIEEARPFPTVDTPSIEISNVRECRAQLKPDRTQFITVHSDQSVRVWNSKTGKLAFHPLLHNGKVVSARYSSDGRRILTLSKGNDASLNANVWDANSGEPLAKPLVISLHSHARFSSDGSRLVTWSENAVSIHDASGKGRPIPAAFPDGIIFLYCDISPDSKQLMVVGGEKKALPQAYTHAGRPVRYYYQLWDLVRQQAITMPASGPVIDDEMYYEQMGLRNESSGTLLMDVLAINSNRNASIRRVDIIRDLSKKRLIDRNTVDKAIQPPLYVWRPVLKEAVARSIYYHHQSDDSFSVNPNGNMIAFGGLGSHLRDIYDIDTGQILLEGLASRVNREQVYSDGRSHSENNILEAEYTIQECFRDTGYLGPLDGYRIMYVAPEDTNPPDWLPDLADAVSGVSSVGASQRSLDIPERLATMERIRQRLNRESGTNAWLRWGRWFLADPATRPPTPWEMPTFSAVQQN